MISKHKNIYSVSLENVRKIVLTYISFWCTPYIGKKIKTMSTRSCVNRFCNIKIGIAILERNLEVSSDVVNNCGAMSYSSSEEERQRFSPQRACLLRGDC